MNHSKPKTAMSLNISDVILEHPYTGAPGEWTVARSTRPCQRHVELHLCADGGGGEKQVLVLDNEQRVPVRATVEEIQHDAATALAFITREGMPPLSWTISDYEAELRGVFTPDGRDEDPEAVAEAWAEFLEIEPVRIPAHGNPGKAYARIHGHYEGVAVRVSVHGLTAAEEKAEAQA